MILSESRERTRILDRGTFRCPRESAPRRYVVVAVRPWFTLASVAVFPGAERCRFVECQGCHSTFDVVVLAHPHTHLEDTLTVALRRATTTILAGGGSIDASLQRAAVIAVQRHASVPYSATDLAGDLASSLADAEADIDALADLAPRLSTQNRTTFVDALVQLIAHERPVSRQRLMRLAEVVDVVGIAREDVTDAMRRRRVQARLAV
jgi:hypothetical protein